MMPNSDDFTTFPAFQDVSVHAACLIGLLLLLTVFLLWRWESFYLPPGPPIYVPVLGHLLKLSGNPVQELRSLRQKYGDVFRLYLGSQLVIVLNGPEVIKDVLVTRGTVFEHRPDCFIKDHVAQNKGILNTNGTNFHEQKSTAMKALRHISRDGGVYDINLRLVLDALSGTLRTALGDEGAASNVDITSLVKRSVCCMSFATCFGRVPGMFDQEIELYMEKIEELFKNLGQLSMVNMLPFMKYLPGDPVKFKLVKGLADTIDSMITQPELKRIIHEMDEIDDKDDRQESDADCFALFYLQEMSRKRKADIKSELSGPQLEHSAGDMMAGSYDTVASTILWVLLYLTRHPEYQDRCYLEISETLDDYHGDVIAAVRNGAALPYTNSTVMEVQRHANIVPFVPGHSATSDTQISSYVIPKGTQLMVNTDSLFYGDHIGFDAENFRPDRFLDDRGKLFTPSWFIPYGAGPRACPGININHHLIMSFVVELLVNFRFFTAIKDGVKVPLDLEGVLEFNHKPKHFSLGVDIRDDFDEESEHKSSDFFIR